MLCPPQHVTYLRGSTHLEAMAMGLSYAKDPYAQGFNALYNYLFDANQALHKHLDSCWNAL